MSIFFLKAMKRFICSLLSLLFITISAQAQLLYKITGNGLSKPSYIMGTYHLANVQFVDSVKGLKDALNQCEQVYGELDMTQLSKDMSAALKMQQYMTMPTGETLDKYLTSEQLTRLNAFLKQYMGADLNEPLMASVKQMKPAALNTTLQVLLFAKEEKAYNPQEQFDTYFQKVAASQQKHVGGLETIDYQMNVLFGAPLPRQAEQLMCTIDNIDYNLNIVKRTIKAYYAQDMAAIEKISEEKMHNSCDATPAEEDALIYTRNKNWAEALPAIMKDKSTFVAVGCLHLPGKRGLLNLLKQAHYTVEAVK